MSERQMVDCPVCEEGFDPTAAGGWCTNPDCGEWKYDGEEVPEPVDEEPTGKNSDTADPDAEELGDEFVPLESEEAAPDVSESNDESESSFDARTAENSTGTVGTDETSESDPEGQTTDSRMFESGAEEPANSKGSADAEEPADAEGSADAEEDDEEEAIDEGGDKEAESDDEPEEEGREELEADEDEKEQAQERSESDATEEQSDEPGTAETAESAETEQAPGDMSEEESEIACPSCEKTLSADANFCPGCGEDVSEIEPESDPTTLTECPSCSADVDEDDSFCATCGENLDAHREPEPEPLAECPSCGADVDEDDSFCASCGENLDAHRETEPESAVTAESETESMDDGDTARDGDSDSEDSDLESLVLEARGETLSVTDGDDVGRQIRRIVTETGGDEDEAVRIHREHIRFVREDGQLHVVDLGANPTRINGKSLNKGDREPVEPGDVIGLSDVITLNVRGP